MTNLGWMQLRYQKLRTAVAIMGIAFAVILILMQLGFRTSLLEGSVRYQHRLNYDIAVISTETPYIVRPASFSMVSLRAVPLIDSHSRKGLPGVVPECPEMLR